MNGDRSWTGVSSGEAEEKKNFGENGGVMCFDRGVRGKALAMVNGGGRGDGEPVEWQLFVGSVKADREVALEGGMAEFRGCTEWKKLTGGAQECVRHGGLGRTIGLEMKARCEQYIGENGKR
ncbi:unnamed protein product [Calypogeia fissa]